MAKRQCSKKCGFTWEAGNAKELTPVHDMYERTVSEQDTWGHWRVIGGVRIGCDGGGKPGKRT